MIKKLFVGMLAVLVMTSMVDAREVSGVDMPETMTVEGRFLRLNGAGTRTKWFMSIYAAGLYIPDKMKNAQKIIDDDQPMVLKTIIISSLMSPKKMEKAFREGFEHSTNGNIDPLKDRIEQFIQAQMEEMNTGDIVEYVYIPGKGVSVFAKGKLATTIEGLDFKKAMFGIWLCDNPCDEDLKTALLNN